MAALEGSSGLVAYPEDKDSESESSGDEFLVPPLKRRRTAQKGGRMF